MRRSDRLIESLYATDPSAPPFPKINQKKDAAKPPGEIRSKEDPWVSSMLIMAMGALIKFHGGGIFKTLHCK